MIVLVRAPFLVVLAGLTVMLALSDRVAPWALPLIALSVASGVMASSFRLELRKQWRVAVCVLVFVSLLASWIVFSLTRLPSIPPFVDTTGIVVESRPWGRFNAVSVKTPQGGFVLTLPFASLTEGQRIRVQGNPRPFEGLRPSGPRASGSRASRPGGDDFREDRFWRARGMTARLSSVKTEPLPDRGFQGWNIHSWRYGLYRSIALYLPRLTGAYLNAAWTGKRDAGLDAAHRSWGTSHLLSVSGFHVGIVMMGASFILKRGRGRVYGLSFLLWSYVCLTGAPASAVRAGLMIQIALLGELARRPSSALNSVSLAGVLLLARSPFLFWDIGWRLSILAALVIAALLERGTTNEWKIWLGISPLIWIATFPQVSWTFGAVPLAGVLINFAAPPFFSFALTLASAVAGVRLLRIPGTVFLSDSLLYVLEGTFKLWGVLADAVAHTIPLQLEWSPFFAYFAAVIFIVLLSRSLFVPWRSVVALAPLGALATVALFGT
ncbi:MAG: ComEC/Rec2 family competence protein [Synergistaceae bacterium]|jgi:competence protein ComEC|nr:ComEC/Rec2 family competence protein [Synergistaceae bacterium]